MGGSRSRLVLEDRMDDTWFYTYMRREIPRPTPVPPSCLVFPARRMTYSGTRLIQTNPPNLRNLNHLPIPVVPTCTRGVDDLFFSLHSSPFYKTAIDCVPLFRCLSQSARIPLRPSVSLVSSLKPLSFSPLLPHIPQFRSYPTHCFCRTLDGEIPVVPDNPSCS